MKKDTYHALLQQKIEALSAVADELPVVLIVHNVIKDCVEYMSPRGLENLGLSLEELKNLGTDYHQRFFNRQDMEDYVPKVFELLKANDDNKIASFFQQVRPSPEHDWHWHLSVTKTFMRDEYGRPTHVLTIAAPVDPQHHITGKINRLLDENNFLRRYYHVFASLTKREKEILKLIALGESSADIAEKLLISKETANTHRRNLKSKLNAESNYDITRFAQAFNLI